MPYIIALVQLTYIFLIRLVSWACEESLILKKYGGKKKITVFRGVMLCTAVHRL